MAEYRGLTKFLLNLADPYLKQLEAAKLEREAYQEQIKEEAKHNPLAAALTVYGDSLNATQDAAPYLLHGMNYGTMGQADIGTVGTTGLAAVRGEPTPDWEKQWGTSEYWRAKAGVRAPQGILENAFYLAGQIAAPGFGEIVNVGTGLGTAAMFLGRKARTANTELADLAELRFKDGGLVLGEDGKPLVWYRGQHGAKAGDEPFSATTQKPSFTTDPEVASGYAQNVESAGLYGITGAPDDADRTAAVLPYYLRGSFLDVRQHQGGAGTKTGITPDSARKVLRDLGVDLDEIFPDIGWTTKWGRGKNAYWDAAAADTPESRMVAPASDLFDHPVVQQALKDKGYAGARLTGAAGEKGAGDVTVPWPESKVYDEVRVVDEGALISRFSPDAPKSMLQDPSKAPAQEDPAMFNEKAARQARISRKSERVGTTGQYVGAPKGVNSPEKRQAYVDEYAYWIEYGLDHDIKPGYFYQDAFDTVYRLTGGDKEAIRQVAKTLGATTTDATPTQNWAWMVQALEQTDAKAKINTGKYPKTSGPFIEAIMRGEDPYIGDKGERFADPIMGNMEGKAPNDQQEIMSFGYKDTKGNPKKSVAPTQNSFIDDARKDAVDLVNNKRGMQMNILNGQEVHWLPVRNLRAGTEVKVNSGDTFGTAQESTRFAHNYEYPPGNETGHAPEFENLSPAEQAAYIQRREERITDPATQRDRLLGILGGGGRLQDPVMPGVGVYEGKMSPGATSVSHVYQTKERGLEPISRNRVTLAEKIRSLLLTQNASGGHSGVLAGRVDPPKGPAPIGPRIPGEGSDPGAAWRRAAEAAAKKKGKKGPAGPEPIGPVKPETAPARLYNVQVSSAKKNRGLANLITVRGADATPEQQVALADILDRATGKENSIPSVARGGVDLMNISGDKKFYDKLKFLKPVIDQVLGAKTTWDARIASILYEKHGWKKGEFTQELLKEMEPENLLARSDSPEMREFVGEFVGVLDKDEAAGLTVNPKVRQLIVDWSTKGLKYVAENIGKGIYPAAALGIAVKMIAGQKEQQDQPSET